MGRLLDLIFPDKAYRREREESERKRLVSDVEENLARFEEQLAKLSGVTCNSFAGLTKRTKEIFDGEERIGVRLEKIECRLESIEKLLAIRVAEESADGKVTPKQILTEYLYGEHGDE